MFLIKKQLVDDKRFISQNFCDKAAYFSPLHVFTLPAGVLGAVGFSK